MRIHRIRLENYRGVAEREIELATEGVTVIHGPNEVGKTSHIEALTLLLDYKDDSRSEVVRSLQPSGRDVGPVVEAEFESGTYHVTYRKQFLRRPKTELVIHAPERKTLTGRPAHHMVKQILSESLDEDLWRALRIDQGTRPEQAQLGSILSLGAALDRAAGEAPAGETEVALFERVHEEYLRYFTERGQPARLLKEARASLEDAEARVDKILQEMKGIEEDVTRASRLDAELKALLAQEGEVTRAAAEAERRWQAVLKLADEVETRRNKRDLCAERVKRAADMLALRQQLIAQIEEARGQVGDLTQELTALQSGHADLLDRHRSAEERLATARRGQEQALEAYGLAQRRFQLRRDEFDLATLTERHDRVSEAMATRASALSILEQTQIDESRLETIKQKAVEVERTRGALDAGGASVSIRSHGPEIRLQLDGYPVEIKAGEPADLRVTEGLMLNLVDQVELEVRPGSAVEGLAKEHQGALAALARLLRDAGVADLESAEQAIQQRRTAELSLRHTEETISANLRDLSLEEMEAKIAALRLGVDSVGRDGIDDEPVPFEEARKVARETEKALHAAQRSLREAEAEFESVARQSGQLSERRMDLNASLRAAQEQLRIFESQLAEARSKTADDALKRAHSESETAFLQAEAELAKADDELSARGPDDLRRLAEDAESAREVIGRRVQELRDRHIELMADLRARGEQGLHASFEEAEAALDEVRRDADRMENRASAARLLYETMANNRQASTRAYVRPLKDAIERLGRVVFGDSFGVEIDETLQISTRFLNGDVVGFKHLSGGAKEQIAMITRIACASLVSKEDGVPVLIDDALGNSDPARLEAMAAVLSLVGRTCQVILLTCHPGWYARIAGAKVISLS